MFRNCRALRVGIIAGLILAWFAASNHCLLAAPCMPKDTAVKDNMPADCPMHSQKQSSSQPVKQQDRQDLPCCEKLPATPAIVAAGPAIPEWLGAYVTFFAKAAAELQLRDAPSLLFNDAGPPGQTSFAELVLQRSLLSHAPPVSLS